MTDCIGFFGKWVRSLRFLESFWSLYTRLQILGVEFVWIDSMEE